MAEVKGPQTFEQAVAQLTAWGESFVKDHMTETEARIAKMEGAAQEQATRISGIEELSKESVRLLKDSQRKTVTTHPLTGKTLEMEQPLHPRADVDEVLRTVNPGGPYKEVQDDFDGLYITNTLKFSALGLAAGNRGNPMVAATERAHQRQLKRFNSSLERAGMKALDTAESGGGSDWIYTGMSASLLDRFYLEAQLMGYFPMFDHPAGVGSFVWPVKSAGSTGFKIGESTADITGTTNPTVIPSQPTTTSVTFTPVVLGARVDLSKELTEDVVLTIVPVIQQDVATALALAAEYAIVSGDTSTTHQDADVTLSYDARKAWVGLRFMGLAATANKTSFGSVAFDETQYGLALKKMGKYGVNATNRMVASVSSSVWWQMLTQFPSLKYWNLWGSVPTTQQSGRVPALFGIPVVPSNDWRSINSSGVVDTTAANNTKTGFVVARTDQFKVGMKRNVLLESQYEMLTQQISILGTTRLAFKAMRDHTAQTIVQYGYNITE